MTIRDVISTLTSELDRRGDIEVKIAGEDITSIDVVDALEYDGVILPAYLDIVGA